jgi:hypothetical protein
MTVEILARYAGVALSLLIAFVPPVARWYEAQSAQTKLGVMGGLLALMAVMIFGLSCAGWFADFTAGVTCDQAGIEALVTIFINALVANQLTYIAAVRPLGKPALAQGDV